MLLLAGCSCCFSCSVLHLPRRHMDMAEILLEILMQCVVVFVVLVAWLRLSHLTLSKKPNKGAARTATATTTEDCNKMRQAEDTRKHV